MEKKSSVPITSHPDDDDNDIDNLDSNLDKDEDLLHQKIMNA